MSHKKRRRPLPPVKHLARRPSQIYYYVVAMVDNQRVVLPPENTSDDAYQIGYERLAGEDFKVVPLRTKDMTKAVRIVRKMDFDAGKPLRSVIKRQRHKL